MGFFKRKKTTSAAKGIEQQAYMQESVKQAKTAGTARAKAEYKAKGMYKKKGSGVGKFVGFMQSEKVQGFGKNVGGDFDMGMGYSKPKKKNKNKGMFF